MQHVNRKVIVVRHAARLDKERPHWRCTSPAPYDSPLSERGLRDAQRVGNDIAEAVSGRSAIVITSPFLRCVQTALPIASAINAHLRVAAVFGEWMTEDYFTECGAPPADNLSSIVASSFTWILRNCRCAMGLVDFASPLDLLGHAGIYGESYFEMDERVAGGLREALGEFNHQVVIIVTHGAICNSLVGLLEEESHPENVGLATWRELTASV